MTQSYFTPENLPKLWKRFPLADSARESTAAVKWKTQHDLSPNQVTIELGDFDRLLERSIAETADTLKDLALPFSITAADFDTLFRSDSKASISITDSHRLGSLFVFDEPDKHNNERLSTTHQMSVATMVFCQGLRALGTDPLEAAFVAMSYNWAERYARRAERQFQTNHPGKAFKFNKVPTIDFLANILWQGNSDSPDAIAESRARVKGNLLALVDVPGLHGDDKVKDRLGRLSASHSTVLSRLICALGIFDRAVADAGAARLDNIPYYIPHLHVTQAPLWLTAARITRKDALIRQIAEIDPLPAWLTEGFVAAGNEVIGKFNDRAGRCAPHIPKLLPIQTTPILAAAAE
jgi:hypothetical protein